MPTTVTLLGILFWLVVVVTFRHHEIQIFGYKVENAVARVVIISITIPFVGIICVIIGYVGLIILSPIIHIAKLF